MDIQGVIRATQQTVMAGIEKSKRLRNDPDFFQKTCQVGSAIAQLMMIRYPECDLKRFSFVLETANMHDFYRFIQQPRQWLFPVSADTIDQNVVLEDLTEYLCNNLTIFPADDDDEESEGKIDEEEVRGIAKKCLEAQLKQMDFHHDAYRNFEEFTAVLQRRLNVEEHATYDFAHVNLHDLRDFDGWMRFVPLSERILNLNWTVVDLGCTALYLQGWKLIDTAKWAKQIGQSQGFQWVNNYELGSWVLGLVCSAFAIKLLKTTCKLHDEALTKQERDQALWNVVTSIAELTLYGAMYLNQIGKTKIDNTYIQCFAIGAKSLGLISIAIRREPQFFPDPDPEPDPE